jgi:hypothetical protein
VVKQPRVANSGVEIAVENGHDWTAGVFSIKEIQKVPVVLDMKTVERQLCNA